MIHTVAKAICSAFVVSALLLTVSGRAPSKSPNKPNVLTAKGAFQAHAATRSSTPVALAHEPYQISFRAGEVDSSGNTLFGNNLMKLVPFNGKLYATTAVECDKTLDPQAKRALIDNSSTPVPQVLVLNHSRDRWHLEKDFGRKPDGTSRFKRVTNLIAVTFETDGHGSPLKNPVQMLIAALAPFANEETCAIFTASEVGGKLEWDQTQFDRCEGQSGRALAFFTDPATKVDRVYVGTQSGHGGEIYSGVFDPQAVGKIHWDLMPEESGHKSRLMKFATLDNRLFAAAHTEILERTSKIRANGPDVSWNRIYDYTGPTHLPLIQTNSGLRGLTPLPTAPGEAHSMLAVMEGRPGDVIRFELTQGGVRASHEAAIASMFSSLPVSANDFGGKRRVDYYIGAFNDIPTIRNPVNNETFSLIGLEIYNRIPGHVRSGWFVSRSAQASYSLHEVRELPLRPGDKPLVPDLGLRAVRTIVVSPFIEDQGSILFMGGFDPLYECGQTPLATHLYTLAENAWLYRVGIDSALER